MQTQKLFSEIDGQREQMVNALMELIRIPAVAPENGGQGEAVKAEKLEQLLREFGFDKIDHYDAPDKRVPSGKRPNIVAWLEGKNTTERLWIVSHLDIVPPGEESLWTVTKPYIPIVKNERVYGRGSEDNMHSVVASMFAAKAMIDLQIEPERTIALAFVADEEQGSTYGIQHLIKQNLFTKKDLLIVPDSGEPDGSFIEIAEKSAIWFRIRTKGKQGHASRPHTGLNAHRIGMKFALALDELLHREYSRIDKTFEPPESTIEPTMKDKNVDAINIMPGEDVIYFDCRILPSYRMEKFTSDIIALAKQFDKKTGATIKYELVHKSIAPKPTDTSAKIVKMLKDALRRTRNLKPRVGGIGGGTCAAYFRKKGLSAVVWSTIDEVAHQPNEYTRIRNLINDAKTYAYLANM